MTRRHGRAYPAFSDTKDGRVNRRVSVKAKNGLVRVVVEEMKAAEQEPAKA